MDGTDGGGSMGSLHGDVGADVNGDMEARMENADGDSGMSTLQSMGYVDNGTGRSEEDSRGSGHSVLQMVLLILVTVFFGGSLLYFLITGLLGMFGVPL